MKNNIGFVFGILFLLAGTLKAESVIVIKLSDSRPTCYEGKTSALTSLLAEVRNKAEELCKQNGLNSVLQDVTDQLQVNLNPKIPLFCGGVAVKLKINCLVMN